MDFIAHKFYCQIYWQKGNEIMANKKNTKVANICDSIDSPFMELTFSKEADARREAKRKAIAQARETSKANKKYRMRTAVSMGIASGVGAGYALAMALVHAF